MEQPASSEPKTQPECVTIPSFHLVESSLDQVRRLIRSSLASPAGGLEMKSMIDHANCRFGKMLRPGLVLLSGHCCGKITETHIRTAAVVEMLHHATLLHDDVIDEGRRRRGAPTVNLLWGNESAVLLGDYVLSRVFQLTADLPARAARLIAATAARVCEGELRQVVERQNWQLGESQFLEIIQEKSAAFFSGCCELGAVLADAPTCDVEALSAFGLYAGIAFQIADDLLDISGDELNTGKTIQSDIRKKKLTLALIRLLDRAEASERDEIIRLLDSPGLSNSVLVQMLADSGSLDYARKRALEYIDRATTSLTPIADSGAKVALLDLAHFMANRSR